MNAIPEAAVEAAAQVLQEHRWPGRDWARTRDGVRDGFRSTSRAALEAAWDHQHPVFTTVEELDDLPVGSVVLTQGGRSFQKYEPRTLGGYTFHSWMCSDGGFVRAGYQPSSLLPARVLWRGEA